MHNTVNKLKSIFIASFCLLIAACSSGGSGSTEGLNITGRWVGTLNDDFGFFYDIVMDFSQIDTVGVPGNSRQSDIIYSVTITRASDANGGGETLCTFATLSGGELTISSEANPAVLFGDGFSAVVIDNKIEGQAVWDDFDSATITVLNDEGETEEVEVECAFGGPIVLQRG